LPYSSCPLLVGCTGLLVHNAFDFSLQVPGNAAFFYVFCAFATSKCGTIDTEFR